MWLLVKCRVLPDRDRTIGTRYLRGRMEVFVDASTCHLRKKREKKATVLVLVLLILCGPLVITPVAESRLQTRLAYEAYNYACLVDPNHWWCGMTPEEANLSPGTVETHEDFYLEDGTYIGSSDEPETDSESTLGQGVAMAAGAAVGGAVGQGIGAQVASWAFGLLGKSYSATFVGYYAVVAGPWVGLTVGAAVGAW